MIYLDNAATSWPKPEIVYQTMDKFLRESGGNPGRGGHSLALAAEKVVEETRLLVARLINAPAKDRVVFTFNCTDSLNLALKGLLSPGDHVITSQIGHNSLVRPLRKLEERGVEVTRLAPQTNSWVVSIKDLKEALTKRTKLVVVTHASNVNGIVQPIEEYGEIVRRHGCIFMVDAAQTAGTFPIDVQAGNIDLIAFSGHKGLFGPPGTGVLYLSERVELDTLREGGTGSHSESEEQPAELPKKYESGTLNTVGIAGLGAGLGYIFEHGIERVRLHEQALVTRLLGGLSRITGITIYKPKNVLNQVPIVSFNLKGWQPAEVGAVLDQSFDIKVRAGLHCAAAAHKTFGTYPHGTVRIGLSYLNTPDDIEAAIDALGKIAKSPIEMPQGSLEPTRSKSKKH